MSGSSPSHRPGNALDALADSQTPAAPSLLLYGVTLRPPRPCWDGLTYNGPLLVQLNRDAARQVPGVVDIVVRKQFIGVVASQPEQARHARSLLDARWSHPVADPDLAADGRMPNERSMASDNSGMPAHEPAKSGNTSLPEDELRPANHAGLPVPDSTAGILAMDRSYTWQPPSGATTTAWAIACYDGQSLTIWVCCTRPDILRREAAALCSLPAHSIHVYPNGQADVDGFDIAADAALLSRSVARPVRVQEEAISQTNGPVHITLSAAKPARISGNEASANNSEGAANPAQSVLSFAAALAGSTISSNHYTARRPSIAALLCGYGQQYLPDAALTPGYYPGAASIRVTPQAASLYSANEQAQSAAQVFARESFFDELSREYALDPVAARLAVLHDPTASRLIRSVAGQAGWENALQARPDGQAGKGFAYSHVVDHTLDPPRQIWSAWIAEVSVDPSGTIELTRLTVGHDCDTLSPVTGVAPQVEDTIRHTAQKLLPVSSRHDDWGTTRPEAAAGRALTPARVDLVRANPALPTGLAWSRHAELPAGAAIANAIHDATGIRFRQAPFNPALIANSAVKPARAGNKVAYGLLGGLAAAATGIILSALPWRSPIALVAQADTSIYSAAALHRGRLVAAAGDCIVCHTASGGKENTGGRALETPFGLVYSTNITPDSKTGIGGWSYAAFDRAMRQGIHRDGRHLYPAFPYTAFSRISDADMQSLYAYLMSQPAVQATPPKTQLAFPYNWRPLMAGWNLLFHRDARAYQPDPQQSTLWNRGAYLVQGSGHCTACHSPRNAMGAEKSGVSNFLSGGFAEGWQAPALNGLSRAPITWTEDELFQYLKTGYSSLHGVAAGPMAPVVQGLAQLPESDVRAIAHYLSALKPPDAHKNQDGSVDTPAIQAARLEDAARSDPYAMTLPGESLFAGACAACHDARGGPPLFGSRPSLALNSNLHSDAPDNVIQVLMHGIAEPAFSDLGYMPGFKDSFSDVQIESLLKYLRQRFAPGQPAWTGLREKISEIRKAGEHQVAAQ